MGRIFYRFFSWLAKKFEGYIPQLKLQSTKAESLLVLQNTNSLYPANALLAFSLLPEKNSVSLMTEPKNQMEARM